MTGLTWPTIGLLVLILILSTGEMIHGQLLKLGDQFFGDPAHRIQYFMLRADPVAPTCPKHLDVEAEVARQIAQGASAPAGQDAIDAMFDSGAPQDPAAVRAAIEDEAKVCAARHAIYEGIRSHITPSLVTFRSVEISFLTLSMLGSDHRALILLLLLASGILLYSFVRFYRLSLDSGVPIESPQVYFFWMGLFAVLSLASAYRVLRPLCPDGQQLGTKFNNGSVDLIFAPAVAHKALEIYRGVGTKGGVSRFPLAFSTMQVVLDRSKFPEGFGEKSRQYWASQFDQAIVAVRKAEAGVPAAQVVDDSQEEGVAFLVSQRDTRVELANKGYDDKQGLKVMKRIRCSVYSAASECANKAEIDWPATAQK